MRKTVLAVVSVGALAVPAAAGADRGGHFPEGVSPSGCEAVLTNAGTGAAMQSDTAFARTSQLITEACDLPG